MPWKAAGMEIKMAGAVLTGKYRNVFKECGYSEDEITKRVEQTFETIFYGKEEERFYHEVGDDMAYMEDTGNHDVRTEGMSYGMMVCVQMNKKEEFDRLWKWVRTYMYIENGPNKNYFVWSCGLDGSKNADGPAPDGEEYFAMALFFASARWGDGEGIFNYGAEAKAILRECVHKGEASHPGEPMWEPSNKLIKFVPGFDFSDPSYHLPHFYELFAKNADPCDRTFWEQAAEASRGYLHLACHPKTGLSAEYADYDGKPHIGHQEIFGRHDLYYSDAYRTIANIGMDHLWFEKDPWQVEIANRLQNFYCAEQKEHWDGVFLTDGTRLEEKALHPVAIVAVNAQASLAADGPYVKECVDRLWDTPLRTGDRRYYDNFLYMFAMLALSGNYRIYQK
jgi:oligosaccharide reducing-end xylanase